jgi:hypothetical protein
MKEQIKFVRWLFSGLELWQWLMLTSMFLNVGSLFAIGTEMSSNMNLAGMSILLVVCSKWFVIDPLRVSWARYKEQRNTLLTTIKNSDK